MNWISEIFFFKYFPVVSLIAGVCFFLMMGYVSKRCKLFLGWQKIILETFKMMLIYVAFFLLAISFIDTLGIGWQITYYAEPTKLSDELKSQYHHKDEHFYKLSVHKTKYLPRWEFKEKRDVLQETLKKIGKPENVTSMPGLTSEFEKELKEAASEKKLSHEHALTVATRYVALPTPDLFISSANNLGPSAGLMATLELIHQFGEEDLVRGRTIAGTGSIESDGSIGGIGGVKVKLMAAQDLGAVICFVPKENYDSLSKEFITSLSPMNVIPVSTIDEALKALRKTR
ncbi:S16 family serine protease [Brevibacillus brevis]|uniref:S16 family serine protease n=1 Tax=Brevibacillus brevis TaxID=1393 RepID=A0ABY9TCQ2_BREBE|nr:S16 family serine protease [Brevibacillus brevis]WNC17888.1 S16 family serine protease [Brevibacillus brevis]